MILIHYTWEILLPVLLVYGHQVILPLRTVYQVEMTGPCNYRGHRETCLIPKLNKYPITKNGKISVGRIRNAAARAAQNNDIAAIKKGGFCRIARRYKVMSRLCSR